MMMMIILMMINRIIAKHPHHRGPGADRVGNNHIRGEEIREPIGLGTRLVDAWEGAGHGEISRSHVRSAAQRRVGWRTS